MCRGCCPREFRNTLVSGIWNRAYGRAHRYQETWSLAELKACHLNTHYLLFISAFELGLVGETGEGESCFRRPAHTYNVD